MAPAGGMKEEVVFCTSGCQNAVSCPALESQCAAEQGVAATKMCAVTTYYHHVRAWEADLTGLSVVLDKISVSLWFPWACAWPSGT